MTYHLFFYEAYVLAVIIGIVALYINDRNNPTEQPV